MRRSVQHFFIVCILPLVLVSPKTLTAAKKPATGISIEKITIGEERIETGRKQLIELLVKNITSNGIDAVAKLSIVFPDHSVVSFGNRPFSLGSKSETRLLFPYPIGKTRGGDYTVGAKILTTDGKVLTQNSENQKKHFFAVDPARRHQKPSRPGKKGGKTGEGAVSENGKAPARPLVEFDPPDLMFAGISILNNVSVLRGESAQVRLVIANDGGDIATNVNYSVYWYFTPRPNRKKIALKDVIKIIAPGEKKIIEIPVTIPETELKGEYFVYATIDENNSIKETNETNNAATSKKGFIFSDIALVFPGHEHSFAEDGLYKFQWRSRKFNQFKVQVSANETFSDKEEMFELPIGKGSEGWTPSESIKPFSGELPGLALALMESNGINFLFWRVIAKDSEGSTTESMMRKFYITRKPIL